MVERYSKVNRDRIRETRERGPQPGAKSTLSPSVESGEVRAFAK
jgi:hypothetical protein